MVQIPPLSLFCTKEAARPTSLSRECVMTVSSVRVGGQATFILLLDNSGLMVISVRKMLA